MNAVEQYLADVQETHSIFAPLYIKREEQCPTA